MTSTQPDAALTSDPGGDAVWTPFVRLTRRDTARVPMPTDDEADETRGLLLAGYGVLVDRIGAVFGLATQIVTKLLDVAASVAGTEPAEARGSGPPVAGRAADPSPAWVGAAVHDVLGDHATSDTERRAITPALVAEVSAGVLFLSAVERQSPGALSGLLDLPGVPPEVLSPEGVSGHALAERAPAPASRESAASVVPF